LFESCTALPDPVDLFGELSTVSQPDLGAAAVIKPAPLNRQQLLDRLLASTPDKYLYHERYTECLHRIFTFVLTVYGTSTAKKPDGTQADPLQVLLERFQLPLLFPGCKATPQQLRNAFEEAAAKFNAEYLADAGKVFDLDFIIEGFIRDLVPEEALGAKGKGQLTYAELAYVFKSISLLVRKHREKKLALGCPGGREYWRHISNKYFLGEKYRNAAKPKLSLPANLKTVSPEQLWELAIQKGYALGLAEGLKGSRKKPHNYCERYENATGRKLNRTKLSVIFKVLNDHGLIAKKEVPSSKHPNCTVNVFRMGAKSNFAMQYNLFATTPSERSGDENGSHSHGN
jgi:hypothetical protein